MITINYEKFKEEITKYTDYDQFVEDIQRINTSLTDLKSLKNILHLDERIAEVLDAFYALILDLVILVEKIYLEVDEFDVSKKEALVQFLDDVIELPVVLEWFDDDVFEHLIDKAVEYLNSQEGHDWLSLIKAKYDK